MSNTLLVVPLARVCGNEGFEVSDLLCDMRGEGPRTRMRHTCSTRTEPRQDQTSKGVEHFADFIWMRKTRNMWEVRVHSKIHSILWWSLTHSITSADPKLFLLSPTQNRYILFASKGKQNVSVLSQRQDEISLYQVDI